MAREKVITTAPADELKKQDAALRPKLLKEVIGQRKVAERLEVAVRGSKKLKEPLGHILFDGPPGLGKTTFATVLPNELGTTIQMTSGPALAKPADLLPFLTNLEEGSILFIDEIHRMPRIVEEFIYPAMEDFRIDIVLGEGMSARTISMQLKRFTLIGATTRSGMLSGPMRDRFKMHEHLEFYSRRGTGPDRPRQRREAEHADHRRRGAGNGPPQPRHAARRQRPALLGAELRRREARRADHRGDRPRGARHGRGRPRRARQAGPQLPGNADRRLRAAGPTGVEALAATMNLAADTLSDEIEPYLLREQFIVRSPRGRVATPRAFTLLGRKPKPDDKQMGLFE